jgi:hypothetical protein
MPRVRLECRRRRFGLVAVIRTRVDILPLDGVEIAVAVSLAPIAASATPAAPAAT